jgi:hypothetical protein
VQWVPEPLDERARDCKDLDAPYSLPLILVPLLPMLSLLLHTVRVSGGRVAIVVVEFEMVTYLRRCAEEPDDGTFPWVRSTNCYS